MLTYIVKSKMTYTHKQQFNIRNGYDKNQSHSISQLSKISKIPIRILKEIYERGRGAWKTNIKSVRTKGSFRKNEDLPRRMKLSAEQWAYARVYSFINKIQKGIKLNHDTDLFAKI